MDQCKCLLPVDHRLVQEPFKSLSICKPESLRNCSYPALENLSKDRECRRMCPVPCRDWDYRIQLSSATFPSKNLKAQDEKITQQNYGDISKEPQHPPDLGTVYWNFDRANAILYRKMETIDFCYYYHISSNRTLGEGLYFYRNRWTPYPVWHKKIVELSKNCIFAGFDSNWGASTEQRHSSTRWQNYAHASSKARLATGRHCIRSSGEGWNQAGRWNIQNTIKRPSNHFETTRNAYTVVKYPGIVSTA